MDPYSLSTHRSLIDPSTPPQQPQYINMTNANDSPPIQYYLTRQNGTAVPLLPADELAYNIKLQNVPRRLEPAQVHGLHWVGQASWTGKYFQLEENTINAPPRADGLSTFDVQHARRTSNSSFSYLQAPDANARQIVSNNRTPPAPQGTLCRASITGRPLAWRGSDSSLHSSSASEPPKLNGEEILQKLLRTPEGREAAARLNYRSQEQLPPSGIIPDPTKKEFCTYWITHGRCNYEPQGCKYKHVMPDTKEQLYNLIGLKQWPQWWMARNATIKVGKVKAAIPSRKPEQWVRVRKDSWTSNSGSESSIGSMNATKDGLEEQRNARKKPVGAVRSSKSAPATRKEHGEQVTATAPAAIVVASAKVLDPTNMPDLIDLTTPSMPSVSEPALTRAELEPAQEPIHAPEVEVGVPLNIPRSDLGSRSSSDSSSAVFVPKSEAAEKNVLDAKKRQSRRKSKTESRHASPDVEAGAAKDATRRSPPAERISGLLDSRHAVLGFGSRTPGLLDSHHAATEPKARSFKPDCRQRVVATSSSSNVSVAGGKKGYSR